MLTCILETQRLFLREFTIDNYHTGNEDQTIRIKNLSLIADNAPKLTLEVIQKIIINN